MKLARIGASQISDLSQAFLWVENLPGLSLSDLVTIEESSGRTSLGRVVAIEEGRCQIRICDERGEIGRDSIIVWADSSETELPVEPLVTLESRSLVPLRTGLTAVDSLFPFQRGQSLFLESRSWRGTFPLLFGLIQGALYDKQLVSVIALDTSQEERKDLEELWHDLGLEKEGLFISKSGRPLHQELLPLQRGVQRAIAQADEGRDVFLLIVELEAWHRLFEEDQVLRGNFHSHRGSLAAFRGELCRFLDLLRNSKGRITVMTILSERLSSGVSSPLASLKDLFDGVLVLESDGALSMDSYTPAIGRGYGKDFEYAPLLRRQIKDLLAQFQEKERAAIALSGTEKKFLRALKRSLADLRVKSQSSFDEIWQILSILPEEQLSRIPLSLLREFSYSHQFSETLEDADSEQ